MKLAWQQIASTVVSDILCANKLDGVVLDTEHGMFNPETLYACIQVITSNRKKAFVRLIDVDKATVRSCLDAGADGIIFSTIESLKQANDALRFSKYPVQGGFRGLGLVRQNKWGLNDLISKEPILIAQIETSTGVKKISEIWDSKVFDYVMVGPYDLTASLGCPGDFEHVLYRRAVSSIKRVVPHCRMAVHVPCNVENEIKKYDGFGIIAVGMDTTFIIEKYEAIQNA